MQEMLMADVRNTEGIKALEDGGLPIAVIERTSQKQMITLAYGIAQTMFQFDWYEKVILEMENECKLKEGDIMVSQFILQMWF